MTKDEAIELLEDLDGAIEDNHGRDYDEAFRMAIESLSADTEWTPVSERLPKVGEQVLCCDSQFDCLDASARTVQKGERGMIAALWIIAVCEVIRAIQNMVQIMTIRNDAGARDNAYAEFVKSLKQTDKEFVKRMLEEFESEEKK